MYAIHHITSINVNKRYINYVNFAVSWWNKSTSLLFMVYWLHIAEADGVGTTLNKMRINCSPCCCLNQAWPVRNRDGCCTTWRWSRWRRLLRLWWRQWATFRPRSPAPPTWSMSGLCSRYKLHQCQPQVLHWHPLRVWCIMLLLSGMFSGHKFPNVATT